MIKQEGERTRISPWAGHFHYRTGQARYLESHDPHLISFFEVPWLLPQKWNRGCIQTVRQVTGVIYPAFLSAELVFLFPWKPCIGLVDPEQRSLSRSQCAVMTEWKWWNLGKANFIQFIRINRLLMFSLSQPNQLCLSVYPCVRCQKKVSLLPAFQHLQKYIGGTDKDWDILYS